MTEKTKNLIRKKLEQHAALTITKQTDFLFVQFTLFRLYKREGLHKEARACLIFMYIITRRANGNQ